MGNVTKKIVGTLFVLVLMAVLLPVRQVKAADKGTFHFSVNGGEMQYCECPDTAFAACYKKGGIIEICKDVKLDFPDYIKYGCIEKGTMLVISEGVTVTIGKDGFRMDGEVKLGGTLDLEHSEGVLYGNGWIDLCGGELIKRTYTVDQSDEKICLSGKDIMYGQTLAEAAIFEDQVNWRTSVAGTWQFLDLQLTPQAGTKNYDVVFKPAYPMTYEEKVFYQCGRVTTKPVVPVRQEYEPWELYAGENLLNADPHVSYIDPISGEQIKGSLIFERAEEPLLTVGEQQVKGTFTPEDGNYAAITEYFKINVRKAIPRIATEPLIRNQGIYGGTLEEIQFVPGTCMHPSNGTLLEGTWEWQDPSQRLELGTKTYTLLFMPAGQGYEIKELQVEVTTRPKEMKNIEWPACSDLTYGQSLADSELSFYKNEYGTFSWENENVCPDVKNQGAVVLFHPANTEIYDWSKLAGYDKERNTVSFVIPVRVRQIAGELPDIQAAEVEEGSCVSGSALCVTGMHGKAMWQQPEQEVEQSGKYAAYFLPEDSDNYDWSRYNPDEQGRIRLEVYVKAKKRAELSPDESGQEPIQGINKVPAGTAVQTTSSSAAEKPNTTDNVGESADGQETAGEKATFVITQMVSKISKIRSTAVTVKKTTWVSRKRQKSQAKLVWKKIKGVRYQLQYGTDRKWKHSRKKMVKKTSVTLRGLKGKKKYYVRIRCVKTKNGRNYYSKWSNRAELAYRR